MQSTSLVGKCYHHQLLLLITIIHEHQYQQPKRDWQVTSMKLLIKKLALQFNDAAEMRTAPDGIS